MHFISSASASHSISAQHKPPSTRTWTSDRSISTGYQKKPSWFSLSSRHCRAARNVGPPSGGRERIRGGGGVCQHPRHGVDRWRGRGRRRRPGSRCIGRRWCVCALSVLPARKQFTTGGGCLWLARGSPTPATPSFLGSLSAIPSRRTSELLWRWRWLLAENADFEAAEGGEEGGDETASGKKTPAFITWVCTWLDHPCAM